MTYINYIEEYLSNSKYWKSVIYFFAGMVKALLVISMAGQGPCWESKACIPAHQASPGLQGRAGAQAWALQARGLVRLLTAETKQNKTKQNKKTTWK